MKSLLLVVYPTTHPHLVTIKQMAEASKEMDSTVRQVLANAFLLQGEKAFDVAMRLRGMTSGNRLPVAILEVEGVLSVEEYAGS